MHCKFLARLSTDQMLVKDTLHQDLDGLKLLKLLVKTEYNTDETFLDLLMCIDFECTIYRRSKTRNRIANEALGATLTSQM